MTIADKIKKLRKDNNMTQEDLAEKLNVSRQTISKWETNIVIPDADNIVSICKLFNITTDELLDYKVESVQKKKQFIVDMSVLLFGIIGFIIFAILLMTNQIDKTSSVITINGSGKTTLAKKLSSALVAKIVSTDEVRKTFPMIDEKFIWPKVYEMCAKELINGKDVIFDATSITPKVRKRLFENVSLYTTDFEVGCYYLDVPIHICKKRVEKRNKIADELYLPIEVIDSYNAKLIAPSVDEGYIFIKIYDENLNLIKELK